MSDVQLALFRFPALPETLFDQLCLDCLVDTVELREYYIVRDDVWGAVCEPDGGMLCIGCLEGRLGRRLEQGEFEDVPINHRDIRRSERLRARMLGSA